MSIEQAIPEYEELMSQYKKLRGDIEIPQKVSIDKVKQWLKDVEDFMRKYFPKKKVYLDDISVFSHYEKIDFLDPEIIKKVVLAVGCELSLVSSEVYDN